MEKAKLPTRLAKEPLLEAIFELRFEAITPVSTLLPGMLFASLSKIGCVPKITKLAVADIPQLAREQDPNLQYAPLVQLEFPGYRALVGDRSIVVSAMRPYPGWKEFKQKIEFFCKEVASSGLVRKAVRHSLKYTDLLPFEKVEDQIGAINWNVRIGNHRLQKEPAHLRIEINKGKYTHIVSLLAGAQVSIPGESQKIGAIVDIDTLSHKEIIYSDRFLEVILSGLDDLHDENKSMFFECICRETVDFLGPTYD